MTPCFPTEIFNQRLITGEGGDRHIQLGFDLIFHFPFSVSHIYQSVGAAREEEEGETYIYAPANVG